MAVCWAFSPALGVTPKGWWVKFMTRIVELDPCEGWTLSWESFFAPTRFDVSAVCMICTPFDCTAARRVVESSRGLKIILSR